SALARDTGFRLGIRNGEPEGDRVAMTVGQLAVVATATTAAPEAAAASIGLWDNAFDAAGTVQNGAAEAANFVGADTQRFFFRLPDASRAGQGTAGTEWRTVRENGEGQSAPANLTLTLVEDAATQGVFLSRAVMLVTDEDDQNQPTHTGLAGGGVVARNAAGH